MNTLLIFLLGFVFGAVFMWWFRRSRATNKPAPKMPNPDLISAQREGKEVNLKKLREYVFTQDTIRNNDVEAFLGVSDATATRYLEALEQEGLLRQVGETGKSVYYKRITEE